MSGADEASAAPNLAPLIESLTREWLNKNYAATQIQELQTHVLDPLKTLWEQKKINGEEVDADAGDDFFFQIHVEYISADARRLSLSTSYTGCNKPTNEVIVRATPLCKTVLPGDKDWEIVFERHQNKFSLNVKESLGVGQGGDAAAPAPADPGGGGGGAAASGGNPKKKRKRDAAFADFCR